MRRLPEAIGLKSPKLWQDSSWFLHKAIAISHTALILPDHFAQNSTYIASQPLNSLDLAPYDFRLFSKLKRPLRRHRFEWIKEN